MRCDDSEQREEPFHLVMVDTAGVLIWLREDTKGTDECGVGEHWFVPAPRSRDRNRQDISALLSSGWSLVCFLALEPALPEREPGLVICVGDLTLAFSVCCLADARGILHLKEQEAASFRREHRAAISATRKLVAEKPDMDMPADMSDEDANRVAKEGGAWAARYSAACVAQEVCGLQRAVREQAVLGAQGAVQSAQEQLDRVSGYYADELPSLALAAAGMEEDDDDVEEEEQASVGGASSDAASNKRKHSKM